MMYVRKLIFGMVIKLLPNVYGPIVSGMCIGFTYTCILRRSYFKSAWKDQRGGGGEV